MLPALSGDCFIIDFENGKCILIDGGYKRTYKLLEQRLSQLASDGKCLEYVILTHYDEDHIAGLIEFILNNGQKGYEKIIPVENIICNDFSELYQKFPFSGAGTDIEISLQQQKQFEETILDNGWNVPSDSITTGREFGCYGYRIKVISPTDDALKKSKEYEENRQINRHSTLISGGLYSDLLDWTNVDAGSELNPINKASIALEIIYGSKSLLFCGDADMTSYRSLLQPKYDLIKLSHHGTYFGNECFCGSDAIMADDYIISTNGARREHPNRKMLAELLVQPHHKRLWLNYDISMIANGKYHLLYNQEQQEKYSFETITENMIVYTG